MFFLIFLCICGLFYYSYKLLMKKKMEAVRKNKLFKYRTCKAQLVALYIGSVISLLCGFYNTLHGKPFATVISYVFTIVVCLILNNIILSVQMHTRVYKKKVVVYSAIAAVLITFLNCI